MLVMNKFMQVHGQFFLSFFLFLILREFCDENCHVTICANLSSSWESWNND
ncbi:hypothetical protein AAHE18_04G185400 [Arachis hypogaea]